MVRRKRVRAKVVKTKGGCKDCGSKTRLSYPPGPRCASCHRDRKNSLRTSAHDKYVLETYGITGEEYWAVYEVQGGVCYICERAKGARKRLSVDHDHKTGEVRGLLCTPCNRNVIGHLRDSVVALQRAVTYLEEPPARKILGIRTWIPDSEKRNK